MKGRFILDTGPLVAWLCPGDEYHLWARRAFAELPAGGIVCEAILAEACHLAAREGIARSKVIEFVERGQLTPPARLCSADFQPALPRRQMRLWRYVSGILK